MKNRSIVVVLMLALVFTLVSCGDDAGEGEKTLYSLDSVQDYLNGASGGKTAVSPLRLKLILDLGNMSAGSGWHELLSHIDLAEKYVELNLSACTITGAVWFNPDSSTSSGKNRIVSMVLPDDNAITIPAGTDTLATFAHFTVLRSIKGGAYTGSIGAYAFSGCTSLVGVNFPANEANLGDYAFRNCSSLASVKLPKSKIIGSGAFRGCTGLRTVNIPLVEQIGSNAFYNTGTAALTINLGADAPTLDIKIFETVTAKTVTVKVPSGAIGYTPFSGTNVTVSSGSGDTWANGLRGAGWNGTNVADSTAINQGITVKIEKK